MVTQSIWWLANALLAALILRCARTGIHRRYPAFFSYLVYVFLENISSFLVYVFLPESYRSFYWNTQIFSIVVGYFVIWEIYTRTLEHFHGAQRLARTILMLAFVILLARYIGITLLGPSDGPENLAVLERDFRSVQVFLISGILLLVGYYRILTGRNMRGIITGYGLYVGAVVASLAFQTYFYDQFGVWSEHLQPLSYLVTLGIWLNGLWVYDPVPVPAPHIRLELDYLRLAEQFAAAMSRARQFVLGAGRP